jgi:hypothetical protein
MISICEVRNINILIIMCCLRAFNKTFSIGEAFPSVPVWRFNVPLKSRDSSFDIAPKLRTGLSGTGNVSLLHSYVRGKSKGACRSPYNSPLFLIKAKLSLCSPYSYGLDGRGVRVRVPIQARILFSPRRPDRLWGPPIFVLNGCRGSVPRDKAIGAWNWPLTSLRSRSREW